MKRPFQVGERIRIYYDYSKQCTGEILNIWADGCLCIRDDIGHVERMAHPKQCRRLVKKKRRSLWVATGNLIRPGNQVFLAYSEKAKDNIEYTEFREVVKGKE